MKERLTEKDNKGRWCVKQTREVDYATVYNCEGSYIIGTPIDRLAELEDKIENGTLIELPCKVGDKAFGIVDTFAYNNTIRELKIMGLAYIVEDENKDLTFQNVERIFKTEARNKLKKLEGDK